MFIQIILQEMYFNSTCMHDEVTCLYKCWLKANGYLFRQEKKAISLINVHLYLYKINKTTCFCDIKTSSNIIHEYYFLEILI